METFANGGQAWLFLSSMTRPSTANSVNSQPSCRRDLLLGIVLICAVFSAYWPTLNGGLLLDDAEHITPANLQTIHGLWCIWFKIGASPQYYPVLHTAFWLEHRLWGDSVLGYHLANIFLHTLSSILLVLIMRKLTLPGSWLAAFIFALHPICVESVAWISEQKNTLSSVFYLSSALLYLSFHSERRFGTYLLASGFFVLALLAKTVTATLPGALLIIFWWQQKKLDWKRDVIRLLPWFALGASAGFLSAWMERKFYGAGGPDFALPFLNRCLLAGYTSWFYLGKFLCPVNLTFVYPRWAISLRTWSDYLPALALLATTGLLWTLRHRFRGLVAAWLFFLTALLPVMGFLDIGYFVHSYVADHFAYLAILGIIIPVAAGSASVIKERISSWLSLAFFFVPSFVILGVSTWFQSRNYRDVETLYRRTLERNPGAWIAHIQLATMMRSVPERVPEAIEHYRAVLQIRPNDWESHNNLGNLLRNIPGKLPEAVSEYEHALSLKPDSAEAHLNLGITLEACPNRKSDAIRQYVIALEIDPALTEAHYNLGMALADTPENTALAIFHLKAAVALKPNVAESHYNLAVLLASDPQQEPEAIIQYDEALRLKPNYAEAHNNLANILAKNPGHLPDAIIHYESALRVDPDNVQAKRNLEVVRKMLKALRRDY